MAVSSHPDSTKVLWNIKFQSADVPRIVVQPLLPYSF